MSRHNRQDLSGAHSVNLDFYFEPVFLMTAFIAFYLCMLIVEYITGPFNQTFLRVDHFYLYGSTAGAYHRYFHYYEQLSEKDGDASHPYINGPLTLENQGSMHVAILIFEA